MASHGRTGLAHLLYGSIAEAVLAHSPVPVFLVHANPGVAAAQFDPRSARIMTPLDGSAFAEAALPLALEVLGAAGELVLLRVVARDQPLEASKYLQQVANQLRQSNLGLHVTCDVRTGDAAHAIAAAQIDRGVDLVVIATHGRSGLGRALLGRSAARSSAAIASNNTITTTSSVDMTTPPTSRSERETEWPPTLQLPRTARRLRRRPPA
jgi:nucleotide-binding universal stress UspA family protein